MPITGNGYEFHIVRTGIQTCSGSFKFKTRTVGTYQVFHDGNPVPGLSGAIFEQSGPGNNTKKGDDNDLCVTAGRYPLATQKGTKYKTVKYNKTLEAKTPHRSGSARAESSIPAAPDHCRAVEGEAVLASKRC